MNQKSEIIENQKISKKPNLFGLLHFIQWWWHCQIMRQRNLEPRMLVYFKYG